MGRKDSKSELNLNQLENVSGGVLTTDQLEVDTAIRAGQAQKVYYGQDATSCLAFKSRTGDKPENPTCGLCEYILNYPGKPGKYYCEACC